MSNSIKIDELEGMFRLMKLAGAILVSSIINAKDMQREKKLADTRSMIHHCSHSFHGYAEQNEAYLVLRSQDQDKVKAYYLGMLKMYWEGC